MNRGERRTRTENIINRRKEDLKRLHDFRFANWETQSDLTKEKISAKKLGRCKKHSPYDCGTPRCECCHSEKIWNLKKHSDEKKRIDELDFG